MCGFVILSVLAKDLAQQVEARSFASTLRMTHVFERFPSTQEE